MSLIKEYFKLTEQYQNDYGENTILLMLVGSFYEVYGYFNVNTQTITGSKISEFSQICELNIVDKKICVGESNIMMAGVKDFMIEKYLKKIQEAGYTAVVYDQDEAAKNTTRSLKGIFSPGTYFQNDSEILNNNITCIWIHLIENKILLKGNYIVVGISNIDIYTGKTSIFQFKEIYINNPTTYDELERFISIYNPSEVIIISNLPNEKEIDNIINYAGIYSNLIHKVHLNETSHSNNSNSNNINNIEKMKRVLNCEKQPYQKEILSKFYNFDDYTIFIQNFYDYNIATQSFCYLLDFVHKHNPHLVKHLSEPIFENCSTRLVLANHSLKQLNIINDGTVKPNKYSCVSQFLNNCHTPMGKRKFNNIILNPTTDEDYLQKEYNITEYYLTKWDSFHSLFKNKLTSIKDISKWKRQIFLKKIPPKSFYYLYSNIETIYNIFNEISLDEKIMDYLIDHDPNIKFLNNYCNTILNFINENLIIDIAKEMDQLQNFDTNFIKKGVDAELDKKIELLSDSESKLEVIREYLSNLIEYKEKKTTKTKSSDYVKINETEKNNFRLICTSRRCKLLEEALPKEPTKANLTFQTSDLKTKSFSINISKQQFKFEKQSSTNNCIVDENINEICKNISTIKISLKDTITNLFNQFVEKFENYQEILNSIIEFITIIDVLHNKSYIAKKYNYCKPNIIKTEKSFIDAKQLRHCLMEQFQTNELYVTNDLILGDNKTNGVLLYGTNAVGKTSFIRALGIAVVMAQAGLFVPCKEFNYNPYKYIFTRIIGNDNIFKGLSTFAVEMSELRTILRLSNENSLILGDELCSGTETMSAISIFVAGIQQLYKCNSSFIFATHLHEIVDFEEIKCLDTISLKHMEVVYDKEKDALVYDRKLKDGPGNNMYGLEVCKSLNLPQSFLDSAYEIRYKYSQIDGSVFSLKSSHYNNKKIIHLCELCGIKPGKEVHHLQHQSNANENGIISNNDYIFHKNNLANLMTLCDDCHTKIHKTNKKGSKRVKTTKGYKIQEI